MPQRCRVCSRANPEGAHYCYHDGSPLPGHAVNGSPVAIGTQLFVSPFVFPSGRACRNFDELVLACEEDWEAAREIFRRGYLESFLGATGRTDLAATARQAATGGDADRALDELLGKLPGDARQPPQLRVQPLEVNLGLMRRSDDRQFLLVLENQGMGLLWGSVAAEDAPWLVLGDAPGSPRKIFQCRSEFRLPIHVHGRALRAGLHPLEGRLVISSSGGNAIVNVRVEVPVTPFPDGVLAGALSPRQVAEKARADPKGAAPLFEQGQVAAWYESNGWTYPVQGPPASGLGAVQQFFEALGLARAPRVQMTEQTVHLYGPPRAVLEHLLVVEALEKRPVFAHAATAAPWLRAGPAVLEGRRASIPLTVPGVPDRPGELLMGKVVVTANGGQRFVVDVTLAVAGVGAVPDGDHRVVAPTVSRASNPPPVRRVAATATLVPTTAAALPAVPPLVAVELSSEIVPVEAPAAASAPMEKPRRRRESPHLVPLALVALALLVPLIHDLLLPRQQPILAEPDVGLVDPNPLIEIRFHDGPKSDTADKMPEPTMRFGLIMLRENDPAQPGHAKRLTYDEYGCSNNTCVRVDGEDYLFGHPPGTWEAMRAPLPADSRGQPRRGLASRWLLPQQHLLVTQEVEVVAGEPSRRLDTCRVRYILQNQDRRPHRVGLRFLLDTFIGANDGVPFTIPGSPGLCDTQRLFARPQDVPDFIEALEHDNLLHPGTVAHLQFRLGGPIEPPGRVFLGGWPNMNLQHFGYPRAQAQMTGWEVPQVSMNELSRLAREAGNIAPADSAVTMYWEEAPLPPGGRREVGFAYGLGTVASGEGGGRLLLSLGGPLVRGGEFTLTALVHDPQAGETLTLDLPQGLHLVDGTPQQAVPPVPEGATRRDSTVTWRLGADADGRHELRVRSSQGAAQKQSITIRTRGVFD